MKVKRILLIAQAILLVTFFAAVPTFAAGVKEPVINTTVPDYDLDTDAEPPMLFIDAAPVGEGYLEYQWSKTTDYDPETLDAIPGATSSQYQIPSMEEGTTYYSCAVRTVKNGLRSDWVVSRMIIVEIREPVPEVIDLEILREPYKVVYTSGERLDLNGLWVRVWMSDGFWDSNSGEHLEITKEPLYTVGEQKIRVAYQGVMTVFYVEVKPAEHTHSFSEWMETTKPTCKEEGIKTRECDCGVTERESIPKLAHTWDKGKVTVKPTDKTDGEKTFTCEECGETKTEVIPAGEEQEESKPTVPKNPTKTTKQVRTIGFLTIILIVVGVLVVGVGVTAVILLTKAKKKNR